MVRLNGQSSRGRRRDAPNCTRSLNAAREPRDGHLRASANSRMNGAGSAYKDDKLDWDSKQC